MKDNIRHVNILGRMLPDMWRKTMYKKTSSLALSGLIAAAYAALTLLLAPISFGPVQVRVAEAMCVLPALLPQAVPGLALGCLLSNLIGLGLGFSFPADVIFGTLATLLAALLTSRLKKPVLLPLPAVVINALTVGLVLTFTLAPSGGLAAFAAYNVVAVGAGQLLACYGLGLPLYLLFTKNARLRELCARYARS